MSSKAISVGELTNSIKRTLENDFSNVCVRGELSNYKLHSSGHRYFTLKDSAAQISCTMWKSRNISFTPADGMKVVLTGTVTVYPPRGNYQIECNSMIPEGQGDLFIAFEALKKKLGEAGYFSGDRKRELPTMPLKIGVSTSPTGAAVKDIFSVVARRFPALTVYFRPTLVQGEGSAEDVATAIYDLNKTDAELIIVGRGGGSIEDLWSYNTEIVADAIFNSRIPVISAVGHETDFTIADFVADLRAATPSAAAELATPVLLDDLKYDLDSHKSYLFRKMKEIIDGHKDNVGINLNKYGRKNILDKIKIYTQSLDNFESSLSKSLKYKLEFSNTKLANLSVRAKTGHPLNPLEKGFAAIYAEGKFVTKDQSLSKLKQVEIIRNNETAVAQIKKILPTKMF